MTKKGNFDGLHKQTVRTYFQKRKYFFIFTRKKLPKKANLMAYVSRLWENISKKGNFDGLCNHMISLKWIAQTSSAAWLPRRDSQWLT